MKNCESVREVLALFLYGDLPAEEGALVAEHLAACPSCQKERAALDKVRRGLDFLPARGVEVNVPAIYQQVMHRRQIQVRRWRRWALAMSAAAAGLLLFIGLGLQVRLEDNQLVIRWASATPDKKEPAPKEIKLEKQNQPVPMVLTFPITPAEVQTLRSLVHSLAEDADNREHDRAQALDRLADRLDKLEARIQANWTVTQRLLSIMAPTSLEGEM